MAWRGLVGHTMVFHQCACRMMGGVHSGIVGYTAGRPAQIIAGRWLLEQYQRKISLAVGGYQICSIYKNGIWICYSAIAGG